MEVFHALRNLCGIFTAHHNPTAIVTMLLHIWRTQGFIPMKSTTASLQSWSSLDTSRRISFYLSPMTSWSCCGMSVVQCSGSGFWMSMLMRQYRGASKLERNVNTFPSLVMYEYWALKLSTSLTHGNKPMRESRNTKKEAIHQLFSSVSIHSTHVKLFLKPPGNKNLFSHEEVSPISAHCFWSFPKFFHMLAYTHELLTRRKDFPKCHKQRDKFLSPLSPQDELCLLLICHSGSHAGHTPVMPLGSCWRSQYQSWLTGSQPSVMDRTAYLPSSDIWKGRRGRRRQSYMTLRMHVCECAWTKPLIQAEWSHQTYYHYQLWRMAAGLTTAELCHLGCSGNSATRMSSDCLVPMTW